MQELTKMKPIIVIVGMALLLSACKNSNEQEASTSTMTETPMEEITVAPNRDSNPIVVEESQEPIEEKKGEEAGARSIFEMGSPWAYIPKDNLDANELQEWNTIIEAHSNLMEKNTISDNGSMYEIDLFELKKALTGSADLKKFQKLVEMNSNSTTISLGFKPAGMEKALKLLELTDDSFVSTLLDSYEFKGGNKSDTYLRRLGVASQENVRPILMEYLNIDPSELELVKALPKTQKINNSLQAQRALQFELSEVIKAHLQSNDCTEGFKKIINFFTKTKEKESKRFMENAQKAKKEFYELNPGWYGEEADKGVTYIDSRNKYIYLPFGELSFADRVVSYQAGSVKGGHLGGSLGAPDLSLESALLSKSKFGNLGLGGVLTIEFTNNTLTNVNGPDLYVFEMGAIEPTRLEVSKDGKEWIEIGTIEGGTAMVDIEGKTPKGATFNYVRLTDLETTSTVPGADIDAIGAIGGALRLNLDSSVLFDTGKFQLKENATTALEELVSAIAEIPKGTIIVEGHTDNVGDPSSNQTLSENRAQEVASYLKKKLLANYNYKVMGLGETQPLVPNNSDENRQKNRRVEILVLPSN